jgi:hypothetical protein
MAEQRVAAFARGNIKEPQRLIISACEQSGAAIVL